MGQSVDVHPFTAADPLRLALPARAAG